MEAELPRPYRVGLDEPRHGKVLQTLAAGHEPNADHIGRSARHGTRHVERVDRTRTSGTDGLHHRQAEAGGRENPDSQRTSRSGTESGKRRAENREAEELRRRGRHDHPRRYRLDDRHVESQAAATTDRHIETRGRSTR